MALTYLARNVFLALALGTAALAGGCSLTAPRYAASLENVQRIKDGDIQPTRVGTFQAAPGLQTAKTVSLRGSSLGSPYENSFADYLAEALKQELSLAGKLSPDAQIEVSGILQKNDISIPLSRGNGDIAARFTVTRGDSVRYDQVKSVQDRWDSSFVGGIAIPRAQEQYPLMVQKLLAELYADPAFLQSLK
jgi:hypothetical protein